MPPPLPADDRDVVNGSLSHTMGCLVSSPVSSRIVEHQPSTTDCGRAAVADDLVVERASRESSGCASRYRRAAA
jgi:hypothetical protein